MRTDKFIFMQSVLFQNKTKFSCLIYKGRYNSERENCQFDLASLYFETVHIVIHNDHQSHLIIHTVGPLSKLHVDIYNLLTLAKKLFIQTLYRCGWFVTTRQILAEVAFFERTAD